MTFYLFYTGIILSSLVRLIVVQIMERSLKKKTPVLHFKLYN